MSKLINKFPLAGDNSNQKCIQDSQDLHIVLVDHSLFASTLVNYCQLPYAKFNGHCLIKNNISIPKK